MGDTNRLEEFIKMKYPKEYSCHIQFVVQIAHEMQKEIGGDLGTIEAASLAHDFGRSLKREERERDHGEVGAEEIVPYLEQFKYTAEEIQRICRCIMMHTRYGGFQSIEEEIVCNADIASKILYHDAFMLMVTKDTYVERARWGLKYIEKYDKLTLSTWKERLYTVYTEKMNIYKNVLQSSI